MDEEEPFPEGEKYLTALEQKTIKELKEICKQKGLSQRGSKRCLISVVYAAWVFDVKDKLTAEERRHTVLLERSEKLEVSGGVSLPDPNSLPAAEWFREVESLTLLPENTNLAQIVYYFEGKIPERNQAPAEKDDDVVTTARFPEYKRTKGT